MRRRTIKPEFSKHEGLAQLSRDHRYFFILLWLLCDSEGRLKDRPSRIRIELMPYDQDVTAETVDGWLSDLAAKGFLVRYEVDGERYICVKNFRKHQGLANWEKKEVSVIPPPPTGAGSTMPPQRHHNGTAEAPQRHHSGTAEVPQRHHSGTAEVPRLEDRGSRIEEWGVGSGGAGARAAPPPAPADAGASPSSREGGRRKAGDDESDLVIPVDEFVEAWNERTDGRLSVANIPPKRRKAIADALRARPDPEYWDEVFEKLDALLCVPKPERAWLTLDWLVSHYRTKYSEPNYERLRSGELDFLVEKHAPRRRGADGGDRQHRAGPRPLSEIMPPADVVMEEQARRVRAYWEAQAAKREAST